MPRDGTVLGLCAACLLAGARKERSPLPGAQRTSAPTAEQLRAIFPDLQIMQLIGQGGMAAVYRARHRRVGGMVALKILLVDPVQDPIMAERFAREVSVLRLMDHPHILRAFGAGVAQGYPFLIMELIPGPTLREIMQPGRISLPAAIRGTLQIANGLAYIHQKGYIHRDIKPENILLHSGRHQPIATLDEFFAAEGRLRIGDFGLAVNVCGAVRNLTWPQDRIGTPDYMAPECRSGTPRPNPSIDVYSLGVLLYEMLTGKLPVGRFSLPSALCPVGRHIDDIVTRCLHNDPAARYADAGEVRAELEMAMRRPLRPSLFARIREFVRA